MADPFEGIVGAGQVRPADGETLDGVPLSAVVCPGTPEEVAACLAEARAHGVSVLPSGAGTKLAWGNRTRAETLVRLDLRRLTEPVAVQPDEGIATFGAGVPVALAEDRARAGGMRTTLDGAREGATVGGTIASDPVRAESTHQRGLRNDVLGLEVALANGTLTWSGGRVVKNVTGFDLVRLYCGSFGTLGVITRAILRVHPLPETRRVLSREYPALGDAVTGAAELVSERVEASGTAVVPDGAGARLLWLLEGGEAEVAELAQRVSGTECGEATWDEVRAAAAGAAGDPGAAVRVRLCARPSDSLELVQALVALVGAGSLRLALPAAGVVFAELPESALGALWERAAAARWLLLLESATARLKERFDVFGPAPVALPLMRALKQRFDPDTVLAPGRFIGGI